MANAQTAVDQVLEPAPSLDQELQDALRYDLVNQIADYETIGKRYGFGGASGLVKFLKANPAFTQGVAKFKAKFSSDMSAQERGRLKAAIASEELVSDIFNIVSDARNTAGVRIDGFKQLNRMAGIDGIPAAAKNNEAQPGNQFSLTIVLPDRTETIATTVVDGATLLAPSDGAPTE